MEGLYANAYSVESQLFEVFAVIQRKLFWIGLDGHFSIILDEEAGVQFVQTDPDQPGEIGAAERRLPAGLDAD